MTMPGTGLARGLAVTLRTMMHRSITREYPDVAPDLPPRTRGVIALLEENCTVCMLCARECPDWCIYIDSHKEVVPPKEEGARPRTRNILDRFAIDFALCMYCGICIEVCPFDALFWSPEFEYSSYDVLDLTHEKDRLRDWMWTVPAPPAVEANAEPAKEVEAAAKAAERPARAVRPERPERPVRADRPERPVRADRPERPAREEPTAPEPTAVADTAPVDVPPTAPPDEAAAEALVVPPAPEPPAPATPPAPPRPPRRLGQVSRAPGAPATADPGESPPGSPPPVHPASEPSADVPPTASQAAEADAETVPEDGGPA